jgi:hypothetical protein
MAGVAHLNQVAGYYDADAHYLRVAPFGLGVFTPTPATCKTVPGSNCTLIPQNAANVFNDYTPETFRRCPGGSSTVNPGSNPFYSPAFLGPPNGAPDSPLSCDSTQVVPGP